jgi:hypothetical protein
LLSSRLKSLLDFIFSLKLTFPWPSQSFLRKHLVFSRDHARQIIGAQQQGKFTPSETRYAFWSTALTQAQRKIQFAISWQKNSNTKTESTKKKQGKDKPKMKKQE